MYTQEIKTYTFNSTSSFGLEVKSIDFLWQKASLTEVIHRADFYHLIWVKEGHLSLIVDFQSVKLKSNEAYLIAPRQVCHFCLEACPEAYSLLFVSEFLGELPSDAQLLHQILSASLLRHQAIPLGDLPTESLIWHIIHELNNQNDAYQLIIARSTLRILLAKVARELPHVANSSSDLAWRFINEVEIHYQHLTNVTDYLPLLMTQDKPLAQATRLTIGMTPKKYIDQRRLLEIKRLLVYSQLSIKEIAFALGFDEPTNFNKFFRKHTSISPNEFRLAQPQHL